MNYTTDTSCAHQLSALYDDARILVDLQSRACSLERLVYAWPNDEKWNVERIPRPTSRNVLNGPERSMDSAPIWCRNDDDDAYFLALQLQRPVDHGRELHHALRHALGERVGHLSCDDRRIVEIPSPLWAGAHARTLEDAVDWTVEFQLGRLKAAGMRKVVGTVLDIARIAQEHVARCEATRLAIANGEPLPNLARPVDILEKAELPEWWQFPSPGPDNAPWR